MKTHKFLPRVAVKMESVINEFQQHIPKIDVEATLENIANVEWDNWNEGVKNFVNIRLLRKLARENLEAHNEAENLQIEESLLMSMLPIMMVLLVDAVEDDSDENPVSYEAILPESNNSCDSEIIEPQNINVQVRGNNIELLTYKKSANLPLSFNLTKSLMHWNLAKV